MVVKRFYRVKLDLVVPIYFGGSGDETVDDARAEQLAREDVEKMTTEDMNVYDYHPELQILNKEFVGLYKGVDLSEDEE